MMSKEFSSPGWCAERQVRMTSPPIESNPSRLIDLPNGEVLIEVTYSSLNYKDALACQAHPGVVRKLPHVPGIDAAGKVVESSADKFPRRVMRCWSPVTTWGPHIGAVFPDTFACLPAGWSRCLAG